MSEPVTSADAVTRVEAFVAAHPERPLFIGIDGFGAAGKSTLADAIAAAVPGVAVVRVDDLSAPALDEWDWARGRRQVFDPLLSGRPARYQRWDWDADRGGEWIDVPAGAVVVLEGVSSTRDELAVPWALRIWVEAPPALRLERAEQRDGAAMLPTWLARWMPSEQRYAAAQDPRGRADLIVRGDR